MQQLMPVGAIAPKLNIQKEEKSGHMWEYVDSREGVDKFRMKPEYDSSVNPYSWESAYRSKNREIEPAIEPSVNTVMRLFGAGRMSLIYKELGFGAEVDEEGTILYMPDLELLGEKWKQLQKSTPGLADLNVLVSVGTSTDDAYIRGGLTHNVTVSVDKERIHDYIIHLVALIKLLVGEGRGYNAYRATLVERISSLYERIKVAEDRPEELDQAFSFNATEVSMLKMSLSAVIDGLATRTQRVDPEEIRLGVEDNLLNNRMVFYRPALTKYGEETLKRLPLIWKRLELATGPISGLPKLLCGEVRDLLEDDDRLPGLFGKERCWLRGMIGPIELPYRVEDGDRLIVDDGTHYVEKKIKGRLSVVDLKAVVERVQGNSKRLRALVDGVPEEVKKRPARRPPGGFPGRFPVPEGAQEGDFSLNPDWLWGYGDLFSLSLVDLSREYCLTYMLIPALKKNVLGFNVKPIGKDIREFVPAESYEELMAHLTEQGIDGRQLVRQTK